VSEGRSFLVALNRNLLDSTALAGAMPANLRSAANIDTDIGTATQAALDLKAPLASPTFTGTVGGITKSMVGLGNVNNTSDADKPISSLTQAALDLKAPLASPTFTGTPAVPTATPGTNTTQAASTAFVVAEIAASGSGGDVVGPASSVNNRIATFSGTTGKLIQDSGTLISGLQPVDDTLTALAAFNTNGLLTQTAPDTFAGRTITGTSDQITVTNGNGVSGNPTLSLPADVLIPTVLTVPNTGLHLLDTNASHDLIIKPGSNITADRTFTLTTGDADRTLDISAASVTISSFIATLLDDADQATAQTTLGVSAGAMVYLSTATPSGAASAAFTSLSSSYDAFLFEFIGVYPATDGQALQMEWSTNNGSSYLSGSYTTAAVDLASSFSGVGASGTPALIANLTNSSTEGAYGFVKVITGSTVNGAATWTLTGTPASGSIYGRTGATRRAVSGSRINAVRFTMASGNLSGKILAWGIKNS
jgi:hypothetical protein